VPENVVKEALKGLYTHIVGRRILHYAVVNSTMDVTALEGGLGGEDGLVVVADEQTKGRGRLERQWVSLAGNLHISVLLRPEPARAHLVTMLATVAAVRAIRSTTGLAARLKWPNDVFLRGRKVAGILAESRVTSGSNGSVVLGIGVNLNASPPDEHGLASIATSLLAEKGVPVDRAAVLRQLMMELDSLYGELKQGIVPLQEWRGYLDTLGRQVRFEWRGETRHGLAEDVDDNGNLVLRLQDGSHIVLPAGEVGYLR
jgi:BirA family biotin operon repressor/biotin-[acetyl-CoA-carboxylase] ligase